MEYGVCYTVNGEKWTCKMGFDTFLSMDRYCYKEVLPRRPLKSKWVHVFRWYPKIVKEYVVSQHLRPDVNIEE